MLFLLHRTGQKLWCSVVLHLQRTRNTHASEVLVSESGIEPISRASKAQSLTITHTDLFGPGNRNLTYIKQYYLWVATPLSKHRDILALYLGFEPSTSRLTAEPPRLEEP